MIKFRRIAWSCSIQFVLIAVMVIWSSVFLYLSFNLYGLQSKGCDINDQQTLALNYEQAILNLTQVANENVKLRQLLKDAKIQFKTKKFIGKKQNGNIKINSEFKKQWTDRGRRGKSESLNFLSAFSGFSMQHEIARRELHNSIWEVYYYLNNQFKQTSSSRSKTFINHTRNQLLSLLGQAAAFKNIDSAENWRRNALADISTKFQNHFDKLQNPNDCKSARILTCDLNKQCGFGCQLHHVAYCFIVAYGSNRTLVLTNDGHTWNYAADGWTAAFLPITNCSYSDIFKPNENAGDWVGSNADKHHKNKRIVKLPVIDSLSLRPPYLPLAIPRLYSDELLKLHSNSPAFFISQFLRYLMRPSTVFAKEIEKVAKKVPFDEGPIVGLQVRRTDKINAEASFHDLDEYMKWTEDWFQIEEYRTRSSVKRRIYIATDDPKVFDEVMVKYPNYAVYGDQKISNTAQVHSRYTIESLIGIVVDIELLSRCTYIVCTFSSQVCRMGYELMQVRFGDAGDRFHSLDDIYYFGGQQAHEQIAVESYRAENDDEIDLNTGDVIGIAGNHWDGFSKGTNRRTGKIGLYPSYKAREKYIIFDFP